MTANDERCENFSGTREETKDLRAADVMVRRPKSLPADATIGDVRRMLTNASLLNVLLVDGGAFAGLIERTAVPDDADDHAPARAVAVIDVPSVREGTPVSEVLSRLDGDHSRRLVVMGDDGHTLAGLICLDHTGQGFCGG